MCSRLNAVNLLLSIYLISAQLQISAAFCDWFCKGESSKNENINLKKIIEENKDNPSALVKYTVKVYVQAVEEIMNVSIGRFENYVDLEEYNVSKGRNIFRFSFSSPNKLKEVAEIARDLLKDIWDHLKSKSEYLRYSQRAFHHRILKWLQHIVTQLIKDKDNTLQLLKDDLYDMQRGVTSVAANYLIGMIPDNDELLDVERYNQRVMSAENFQNFIVDEDEIVEAFEIIGKYGIPGIEKLRPFPASLSSAKTVDNLLRKCDVEKFKNQFGYEPYQMLMFMDYGREFRSYPSNGFKSIIDRKPNLAINFNHPRDVPQARFSWIFYYHAMKRTFWKDVDPNNETHQFIFPSVNHKIGPLRMETDTDVYKLLDHFDEKAPTSEMRELGLVHLYRAILRDIDTKMKILRFYSPQPAHDQARRVYYRYLDWMSTQTFEAKYSQASQIMEEISTHITKILKRENRNSEFTKISRQTEPWPTVQTLEDLMNEIGNLDENTLSLGVISNSDQEKTKQDNDKGSRTGYITYANGYHHSFDIESTLYGNSNALEDYELHSMSLFHQL